MKHLQTMTNKYATTTTSNASTTRETRLHFRNGITETVVLNF